MAGAAVGAISSLAGGFLQNRSQNKALEAQERARREAMTYERQKEAQRRKQYENQVRDYRRAVQQWYQRFGERGIQRYGVPVGVEFFRPEAAPGGAPPGPGGAPTPGPGPGGAVPRATNMRDAYAMMREDRKAGRPMRTMQQLMGPGGAPAPAPAPVAAGPAPPPPASAMGTPAGPGPATSPGIADFRRRRGGLTFSDYFGG